MKTFGQFVCCANISLQRSNNGSGNAKEVCNKPDISRAFSITKKDNIEI